MHYHHVFAPEDEGDVLVTAMCDSDLTVQRIRSMPAEWTNNRNPGVRTEKWIQAQTPKETTWWKAENIINWKQDISEKSAFQLYQRDTVALCPSDMLYTEKMQHLFLLHQLPLCKSERLDAQHGVPLGQRSTSEQKKKKERKNIFFLKKRSPETYGNFIIR